MHKARIMKCLGWCMAGCVMSTSVFAGRPLTVDDAGINEKGRGHVEFWYERGAGKNNAWHVSPAYAVSDRLELSMEFAKDNTAQNNFLSVQGKFLFTPSNENGCNAGMNVGIYRENDQSHQTPYARGLFTCNNQKYGSVLMNLGVSRNAAHQTPVFWGVAYEKNLGKVTPHIEYFGEKYDKPTVQAGLRGTIFSGLQLDGTIGRKEGDFIFSLGMKKQF